MRNAVIAIAVIAGFLLWVDSRITPVTGWANPYPRVTVSFADTVWLAQYRADRIAELTYLLVAGIVE